MHWKGDHFSSQWQPKFADGQVRSFECEYADGPFKRRPAIVVNLFGVAGQFVSSNCHLILPLIQHCLAHLNRQTAEVTRQIHLHFHFLRVEFNDFNPSSMDFLQILPRGWRKEEMARPNGLSAGKLDVTYIR